MARMQKASLKKAPLINDWIVLTQKKTLADAYTQNFPRFRGLPGSESIRDILHIILSHLFKGSSVDITYVSNI